jgi:hypothetical protein
VATRLRGDFLPLIAVILLIQGCRQDSAAPPQSPPPNIQAADVVLTVEADDLLGDFRDNMFAASLKYKDKWLRVRGKCGSVTAGPDRPACLLLKHSRWAANTAYCYPDKAAAAEFSSLQPGCAISVIGFCRKGGVWEVYLDDCRLETADEVK